MSSTFYAVRKEPTGWKLLSSVAFATIDEARTFACKFSGEVAVSRVAPADIGCGWTGLNRSELV